MPRGVTGWIPGLVRDVDVRAGFGEFAEHFDVAFARGVVHRALTAAVGCVRLRAGGE